MSAARSGSELVMQRALSSGAEKRHSRAPTGTLVHCPQERWFAPTKDGKWPAELLNSELHAFYNPEGEIEGCDWIKHYAQMPHARRLVYRCIESPMNLDGVENSRRALTLLYGAATVRQAEALLNRRERYFGLAGANMQGSTMRQTLLAGYDKLFAPAH